MKIDAKLKKLLVKNYLLSFLPVEYILEIAACILVTLYYNVITKQLKTVAIFLLDSKHSKKSHIVIFYEFN